MPCQTNNSLAPDNSSPTLTIPVIPILRCQPLVSTAVGGQSFDIVLPQAIAKVRNDSLPALLPVFFFFWQPCTAKAI